MEYKVSIFDNEERCVESHIVLFKWAAEKEAILALDTKGVSMSKLTTLEDDSHEPINETTYRKKAGKVKKEYVEWSWD